MRQGTAGVNPAFKHANLRVVAQRVAAGSVSWDTEGSERRATIGHGFVLLVGAASDDDDNTVRKLADKIIDLRVFADEAGRMNLSLVDVQRICADRFAVHAVRRHEPRPPAEPAQGGRSQRAEQLYEVFVERFRERGIPTETGSFGADMRVAIENDGPVTLVMSTDEWPTRV